ncbi:hypothetical protein SAMN06295945_1420 [Polynucleobacter meluiroseus]|uniref:Uncharacterized protein n=2 Tax=Polynucleobacter meluiroseus TaxID=1938814 RepID=A0A240E1F3_9BURK|nr:hypothetical protein SAMN06295945_1420 [Polynucleobacter meluiroseus]
MLVSPLLKTSAELAAKQIEYEKVQSLTAEAERALELIGRAIRMAGFRNTQSLSASSKKISSSAPFISLQKGKGFRGSDSFLIRHELSDGVDLDCVGNVLTKERTKGHWAQQGFLVERQATAPKGFKVNGGSLICQSLDRHGRMQNTTVMNGVNQLSIDESSTLLGNANRSNSGSRLFVVKLQMTDGKALQREFSRTFATRNPQ